MDNLPTGHTDSDGIWLIMDTQLHSLLFFNIIIQ